MCACVHLLLNIQRDSTCTSEHQLRFQICNQVHGAYSFLRSKLLLGQSICRIFIMGFFYRNLPLALTWARRIHSIPSTTSSFIYRVSQEEWTKLREGVSYVKLYRYNPKHLYSKLNGYGDNGHRKVWASGVSTYCTPSVTPYSPLRMLGNETPLANIVMQWPGKITNSCGLRKLLGNLRTNMTVVRVFL